MREPDQVEVLAWLSRTGQKASDAVDHFWPGADDARRKTLMTRVRTWVFRAQAERDREPPAKGVAGDLPEEPPDSDAVERPKPDGHHVRLARIDFLAWQLDELVADIKWARDAKQLGRIPGLNAQITEVRQALDDARAREGSLVSLERSPGAIAEVADRQRQALAILAAAQRAREREL